MKKYKKPSIIAHNNVTGIVPLAAVAGYSLTQAALVGAAVGLLAKGDNNIVVNQRKLEPCAFD